jgi:hypothetical protein
MQDATAHGCHQIHGFITTGGHGLNYIHRRADISVKTPNFALIHYITTTIGRMVKERFGEYNIFDKKRLTAQYFSTP